MAALLLATTGLLLAGAASAGAFVTGAFVTPSDESTVGLAVEVEVVGSVDGLALTVGASVITATTGADVIVTNVGLTVLTIGAFVGSTLAPTDGLLVGLSVEVEVGSVDGLALGEYDDADGPLLAVLLTDLLALCPPPQTQHAMFGVPIPTPASQQSP